MREKSYPNSWKILANSLAGTKSVAAPPIKFKLSSTMGSVMDKPMEGELNTIIYKY